jgi:hypothetical protein
VRVKGQAQDNNMVSAERIELLPAGATLPDLGDEHEIEPEKNEGPTQENENNSGKGSELKSESFNGTVNSMENNVWDVNGIRMDVSSAEIKGTPDVGASVKVEGFYDANGVFVATKIEFENGGSGSESGLGSDNSSNDNSHSTNINDSHDDSNPNSNDSSGGGGGESNSGSGGGGGDD